VPRPGAPVLCYLRDPTRLPHGRKEASVIAPTIPRSGLDGPSRTIILDPVEQPEPLPRTEPEPLEEPPVEAPDREPEEVPA